DLTHFARRVPSNFSILQITWEDTRKTWFSEMANCLLLYQSNCSIILSFDAKCRKRTRLTVEALEVRGFSYSLHNPEAKKQKLTYLKFRKQDYLFIITQTIIILLILWFGATFPS